MDEKYYLIDGTLTLAEREARKETMDRISENTGINLFNSPIQDRDENKKCWCP